MLSVRHSLQATSSLLRGSIRRPPLVAHKVKSPFPATLAPSSLALDLKFRFFSQQTSNTLRDDTIVFRKDITKPLPMDLAAALTKFGEVQQAGTLRLTKFEASTLVFTLAKHKRRECAELLRLCQEQNIRLQKFAHLSGFSLLCFFEQFDLALAEFERVRDTKMKLAPWVFAGALDAATRLNRSELVKDIFRQVLTYSKDGAEGEWMEVNGDEVFEMVKDARDRDVKLSEFALRTLVIFAEKSRQPVMTLELFSFMRNSEGVEPTIGEYSSVLVACGTDKRWDDVIKVFETMPAALLSQLNGTTLGHVVMAHTQSKSEELLLRGLDIFGEHKEKWNKLACTAALEGLLHTQQFGVLVALAHNMQHRKMKWDLPIYKTITLAHIRSGSLDKAKQFLHDENAECLANSDALLCYRELIDGYANTNGDIEEACQLYLEMARKRMQLNLSDLSNALELALQLSDHRVYWSIRKHFWLRNEAFGNDLPEHLFLPAPGHLYRGKLSSNAATALKRFRDIRRAGGVGLTTVVASTLLNAVANNNDADTCLEMWDYFEEQGVLPKPFVRFAAFRVLSEAKKHKQAWHIFKTFLSEDSAPRAWTYPKAIQAAIKLENPTSAAEVFHHLQEHQIKLARKDYLRIIKTCLGSRDLELACSTLSAMQNKGLDPPAISIFDSLLSGCGAARLWNMVIDVYNGMPADCRSLVSITALKFVLTAHSCSENEKLQQRTLEIFKTLKEAFAMRTLPGTKFPYEAAMSALLEAKEYAAVIDLADEARYTSSTTYPIWTPMMYRALVMAYIRTGAMAKAAQLVTQHAMLLNNISVECYRELISHYSEVRGEVLEACKLSLLMARNNRQVTAEDWRTSLDLALQLPDRAMYSELLKWQQLHGKDQPE